MTRARATVPYHIPRATGQAADRLTAKVAVREDIVSTFVGHGGSEIRKLRRLCVGCDLGLSPATDGVAEVLLLADDEARLAAAVGLVEKWVHHQQVRTIFRCTFVYLWDTPVTFWCCK